MGKQPVTEVCGEEQLATKLLGWGEGEQPVTQDRRGSSQRGHKGEEPEQHPGSQVGKGSSRAAQQLAWETGQVG